MVKKMSLLLAALVFFVAGQAVALEPIRDVVASYSNYNQAPTSIQGQDMGVKEVSGQVIEVGTEDASKRVFRVKVALSSFDHYCEQFDIVGDKTTVKGEDIWSFQSGINDKSCPSRGADGKTAIGDFTVTRTADFATVSFSFYQETVGEGGHTGYTETKYSYVLTPRPSK